MRKLTTMMAMVAISASLLTACSGKTENLPSTDNTVNENVQDDVKVDVALTDILEEIKAAYGDNYLPKMPIEAEFLEAEFGITSDMYEEVVAEQPMMSVHADRIVLVKAKEGKGEEVEKILNDAKDKKINDTLQYPMNIAKINATKVVRKGDYVAFILLGAINDSVDVSEEAAKQFAEDEVAKGVNAFNELFQ